MLDVIESFYIYREKFPFILEQSSLTCKMFWHTFLEGRSLYSRSKQRLILKGFRKSLKMIKCTRAHPSKACLSSKDCCKILSDQLHCQEEAEANKRSTRRKDHLGCLQEAQTDWATWKRYSPTCWVSWKLCSEPNPRIPAFLSNHPLWAGFLVM